MADQDYAGQAGITAPGSGHNSRALQHRIAQDARRGLMPVRIVKVTGGGIDGPPVCDVQPLVKQADGLGNTTSHGVIYGVSTGRQHSGSGSLISDPVVGDVYAMMPADRDVSKLRRNGWQESGPDSARRGSLSDGVLHHALTGKATQAVFFKPGGGVKIFDKGGAFIETSADGKTVTVTPADGGTVYLGGDPSKGGTFDFVMTASGPSSSVKAKL
jgi:hypothetical protein